MPLFSYLQFTKDSEDMNVPGSNDPTKPSEGWRGQDVNNALRATNSAVRNLGDSAAKLKVDGDGNPILGPNNGQIGSAAFQDVDNLNLGTVNSAFLGPNVRGAVPFGAVIGGYLAFPTNATILDNFYQAFRLQGFDICDGRTASNPYPPGNNITMPDFTNTYPFFTSGNFLGDVGRIDFVGDVDPLNPFAKRTTENGAHDHGGFVGDTQLGYDALPQVVRAVTIADTGGNFMAGPARSVVVDVQNAGAGVGAGHDHTIGLVLGHTHAIDVRPRSIILIPFMRVW
jgi:hypothetical protein